ncbi:MAG: A24 family peptidase [Steroidobacteraceae bacterium]|jgi:leader peptidase (prepilin peptidase)/N-methyltransferase|nr:A24 family peptidase [Steroidobacteraceae bacterium]
MELFVALREIPWSFVLLAGLLGLLVGSFLNVVIHRLPKMMENEWRAQCAELAEQDATAAERPAPPTYNLVTPRSACPSCGAPVTAAQNIPVLSWLLLRGRCASCKAPISGRYPIVEAATGLLSAYVAFHFGWGPEAACALVITWFLIAMTGIDLDTQLLPDSLTLPLMWLGLLAAAFLGRGAEPIPVDLQSAVLGAAFGYLSLWSIFHLFRLLTGKEGMGYGDFKLFAALGAWLGWQMLLPVILFSAATGAVIGILLIVLRRHGREVPIPFGPYLAAAGWLVMMFAPQLVEPWWALAR